ncbi:restriction endonuclease subunit S [Stenotrophomonas indicatrix]
MNELPAGWTTAPLDAVGKWGSGGTPARGNLNYFGGNIPWAVIGDLNGGTLLSTEKTITDAGLNASSAKLVPAGSLLVAMYGSIGKLSISGIECATNQAIAFCIPENEIVLTRYLFHVLTHARAQLIERGQGAGQQNISQTILRSFDVPLAPLAEQKRIVQKLDVVLAKVESIQNRMNSIPRLLEKFRHAVLKSAISGDMTTDYEQLFQSSDELLAQLKRDHEVEGGHVRGNAANPVDDAHDLTQDEMPSHWRVAEMREICTPGRPITYGILKPGPELSNGVPYIRVADFPKNKLDMSTIRNTSSEIDFAYRRARLNEGDLVLSIRGSVGRVIKTPSELQNANITQDTARLSISNRVSADYVLIALKAESTQRRMRAATKGVAVRGINIGDVRALQIPLPPRAEQERIVQNSDRLFAIADQLDERVEAAKRRVGNLTQALLAKAFRGELVPQDPRDEPASLLMERVRSDRAKAPKAKRDRRTTAS